LRRSSVADHFDVPPQNAARVSGAERLHARFFRGKPAGKVRRRIAPPRTIGNLAVGEDPVQKPLAVPFHHIGDTRDVGCIETQPDDVHAWSPA